MKYLTPPFGALHAREATKASAQALFVKVKPALHPIAQQVLTNLLAQR